MARLKLLTISQMSVLTRQSRWTFGKWQYPLRTTVVRGKTDVDENPLTNSNRGTRFVLSRDELLTLPEFVLLSLFPNGLFPEGHMSGFPDSDAVQVDVRKPPLSNY